MHDSSNIPHPLTGVGGMRIKNGGGGCTKRWISDFPSGHCQILVITERFFKIIRRNYYLNWHIAVGVKTKS